MGIRNRQFPSRKPDALSVRLLDINVVYYPNSTSHRRLQSPLRQQGSGTKTLRVAVVSLKEGGSQGWSVAFDHFIQFFSIKCIPMN